MGTQTHRWKSFKAQEGHTSTFTKALVPEDVANINAQAHTTRKREPGVCEGEGEREGGGIQDAGVTCVVVTGQAPTDKLAFA